MPLQTVEPMRLYRQIAGQIATLIDNGEYTAGSRLPPERELATLLGVSRTSVREAIIALEIAGRVEVHVGTGIFVTTPGARRKPDSGATSERDDGPGPFELLAARSLIEGEIAALAARNATAKDIVALRETIARMRAHADDFRQRDAADRDFHVLVAEITGNGALPSTVGQLWDQRQGDLWAKIEEHFHTPALRAKTLIDHEAIVAAIEARDADAARASMHRHLQRVAHEFQRRIDTEPAHKPAAAGKGKKIIATRGATRPPS